MGHEQHQQARDDWHLMAVDQVLEHFNTSGDQGLAQQTAVEQLARYGPNQLPETRPRSALSMLMEQVTTVPVALLSGAAVLSIVTSGWIDALVIMGVVVINAVIGFFTEQQSETIIHSLRRTEHRSAMVVREGQMIEIPLAEVVPGDILILQAGSYVAADARLIQTSDLSLDESALTGESQPVVKQTAPLNPGTVPLADRVNLVFQGTFVASGSGRAVVVATGKATEIGHIQLLVGETAAVETPLQRQLDEVGGQLVLLCSSICALIFAIAALRGYGLLEMLKMSISLAVAAVPEGLPTVATTTLALGIQSMRQRNILIRGLNAVEALGAMQVICLDKTGTITQNKMVVEEVAIAANHLTWSHTQFWTEAGAPLRADHSPELQQLLRLLVLCRESSVVRMEGGDYQFSGSSTEKALMELAIASGVNVHDLQNGHPLLDLRLRAHDRNLMSTIHAVPGGGSLVAVKGNPAEVLEQCESWQRQGAIVPLSLGDRQQILQANYRMATKALRVLGVAYTEWPQEAGVPDPAVANEHLIWVGLVGLADPIRDGVPELAEAFHQAGVRMVMLTGDQRPTAQAIGQKLNLSRDRPLKILDAHELASQSIERLSALCATVDIFARISPADKLHIVQALQATGQVVAMTGDGVNDTPALKASTIGVAMGSGGADIVHEVADVVIQDDKLGTLIEAVSQGRTIYSNIRKAVHFLLATNLSEIMVVAIATAAGLGEPMNALQLLWLNLVTDIFPGLGLALEPPEPEVLNQPPRDPETPIIQSKDFQRIAFEGGMLSLSALLAYGYGMATYGLGRQASTIVFMSLTIGQVLHTFSCRSEHHRWFDRKPLPRNRFVEVAIMGSLALQLLPLLIPSLGQLLKVVPLAGGDYGVIAIAAVLPLLVNEFTKPTSSHQLQSELSDESLAS